MVDKVFDSWVAHIKYRRHQANLMMSQYLPNHRANTFNFKSDFSHLFTQYVVTQTVHKFMNHF